MGNCGSMCTNCGDESTQIQTLEGNQLKNNIKDKDASAYAQMGHHEFGF
jgi:hypothetical protein